MYIFWLTAVINYDDKKKEKKVAKYFCRERIFFSTAPKRNANAFTKKNCLFEQYIKNEDISGKSVKSWKMRSKLC